MPDPSEAESAQQARAPEAEQKPDAAQAPGQAIAGGKPEVAGGKAEEAKRKSADLLRAEQVDKGAAGERYADTKAKVAPPAAAVSPLPSAVKSAMERAFATSFSDVQVYYGSSQADQLGALAFTTGNQIHFGSGAPDMRTPDGKRLLAHELTHVVQQRSGVAAEAPADLEGEADAAAAAVMAGKPAKASKGSVARGTIQMGGPETAAGTTPKRQPSAKAVANAQERVSESSVNRTGDFSVAGKATGNDYEFVKNGGKYYVRRKPQATKDANTVRNAGGDPASTAKNSALKPQHDSSATIFEAEAGVSANAFETAEGGKDIYSGGAGTVNVEGKALGASASASAGGTINGDGVEVKAGAAVNLTLVDGKLAWTLPTADFDILGEKLRATFGTELTAQVAASAEGNVSLSAGKKDGGVKVGAAGGGEAFAGARAGFKIFGKGSWVTPGGELDFVGAFAGAEAWAGAAAAAQFTASLLPSVKFEGYLGAAVGVGASCKVGAEAHLYHIGALGYALARKGLPMAFQGLEQYATQITDYISTGAAWLLEGGMVYVDAVSSTLLGDSEAVDAVSRGLHLHMRPKDRAGLLNQILSGTCWDAQEDAILQVLRDSKRRGELWSVVAAVEGGLDQILWKLDGEQDAAARRLLGVS